MSVGNKINFLDIAKKRGHVHQILDEDSFNIAQKSKLTAYIGYDATAPSLHVGSLVTLMLVRLWLKAGHRIIILFGGGTSKVGDPSGKNKQRQLISDQTINNNIANQRAIIAQVLLADQDGSSEKYQSIISNFEFDIWYNDNIKFVNNHKWLNNINYVDFLRNIGRHFSINRMLSFDSVKSRLENITLGSDGGLTFLEFNYMILQAYDFLSLHESDNCLIQFGGSDQWGNIVNGVDLIRKVKGNKAFALTVPLLTTANGVKMGKTEKGAVWINPESLSSFDFWQFFRNTSDDDVVKFLKIFTEIDLEEINQVANLRGDKLNPFKIQLANHITRIVRGSKEANKAQMAAEDIFKKSQSSDNLTSFTLDKKKHPDGNIAILDLLCLVKFATSKSEAKRLIANRGIRIDDVVISDNNAKIDLNNSVKKRLSLGKKKHILLKLTN